MTTFKRWVARFIWWKLRCIPCFSRVLLMVFSLSFQHHGKSYDLSGTNFFLQHHTSIHVHGYSLIPSSEREGEERTFWFLSKAWKPRLTPQKPCFGFHIYVLQMCQFGLFNYPVAYYSATSPFHPIDQSTILSVNTLSICPSGPSIHLFMYLPVP